MSSSGNSLNCAMMGMSFEDLDCHSVLLFKITNSDSWIFLRSGYV